MLRFNGHDIMGLDECHRWHIRKVYPIHGCLHLNYIPGTGDRNFARRFFFDLLPIYGNLKRLPCLNPAAYFLKLDPIHAAPHLIFKTRFSTVTDCDAIVFFLEICKYPKISCAGNIRLFRSFHIDNH
ncbi:hypothetical protein D3C76_994140 [compost metagenome]